MLIEQFGSEKSLPNDELDHWWSLVLFQPEWVGQTALVKRSRVVLPKVQAVESLAPGVVIITIQGLLLSGFGLQALLLGAS